MELILTTFTAPWCSACRAIKPTLKQLADQNDLILRVIDVDDNPELARQYNITSIPAVLFMKGEEVLDRVIGAQTKSTFLRKIEQHK